jgi:hypothetical protein
VTVSPVERWNRTWSCAGSPPASWWNAPGRLAAAGPKQELVDDVFHKVARRYDLMNDLMSAGLHRLWKDALVASLSPPAIGRSAISTWPAAPATSPSACWTPPGRKPGDRARHQRRHAGSAASARRRAFDGRSISSRQCRGLPFDRRFDAYTIAFGIRNVPRIELGAAEAYRVLKRGGRFLCLEFSPSTCRPRHGLRGLFLQRHPALGRRCHRRRRALPLSRRVDPQVSPTPPSPAMIRDAGFGARHPRN